MLTGLPFHGLSLQNKFILKKAPLQQYQKEREAKSQILLNE